MADLQLRSVLRHLRRLAGPGGAGALTDAQLLECIAGAHDKAAFEVLVWRHGPMVLGVCRHLLGHDHDAEDAFQATFLTLIRKAGSIGKGEALAGWLYQVACRIALRARAGAAKRKAFERRDVDLSAVATPSEDIDTVERREVRAVLAEELQRLPAKYRTPLIACYLQGKTHEQAARELGRPLGSLSRHLARGRELLRDRLEGRGVALSAGLLAVLMADKASAVLPAALVAGTVTAALEFAAGATATASAEAAALAHAVLKSMLLSKLKIAAGLLLAVSAVTAGAGVLARQALAEKPAGASNDAEPKPAARATDRPEASEAKAAKLDRFGDPLPAGAVARLGTLRLQPGGMISHLAYAPDGKRLASWSVAGLSVWDTATGRELRHVDLPDVRLHALAWLTESRGVAVLQLGDDSFYIWDFADEKASRPPAISRPKFGIMQAGLDHEYFSQVALSPDAKHIAAGRSGWQERERKIDIWEVAPGKRLTDLKSLCTLGPQAGNCAGLAFSADGRSLFAFSAQRGAKEERLVVWEVATGQERKQMNVPPTIQQGHVKVLASAPDGHTVALGLPDGTARLWDVTRGEEQRSLGRHVGEVESFKGVSAVAFDPVGRTLITAGRDGIVRVWEASTGREMRMLGRNLGWVEAIVLSPDGKRIATAGQSGLIRLWDSVTGEDVCPVGGHRDSVWGVAVAPDGTTAATASSDRTLLIWDLATGRERRRIDLGSWPSAYTSFTLDGKALLVGLQDGLRLYHPATGEPLRLPGALIEAVGRPLGFAADERTLLTAHQGVVSLWDWPAGRFRQKIELTAEKVKPEEMVCASASLSIDGRLLAVRSERHWQSKTKDSVQSNVAPAGTELWDLVSGRRLQRLNPADVSYARPFFTPDGRSLILAGNSFVPLGAPDKSQILAGALSLWDPTTFKMRRTFAPPHAGQDGDSRWIQAVTFSPDGRTLATAEDRSVLLYELATGGVRRRLTGHRGGVLSLAFTPDGRRLVTASLDHTALVWDVSLAAAASRQPAGPLTDGEKDKLWLDLAQAQAEPAYRALGRLAAVPGAAIALVKQQLRPAAGPDDATLDRLFADLDSDRFPVRERASAELDRYGDAAVAGVRARAAKAQSAEVRRRVERFLARHDGNEPSADSLRTLRVLELLEQIGDGTARAVLGDLSKGSPAARLTQEAKASLDRLAKRPAASP